MTVLAPLEGLKLDLAAVRDLLPLDWSAGRDLNPRLYGFAGRSLGPLGHRRRDSQRTASSLGADPVRAARRPSTSRRADACAGALPRRSRRRSVPPARCGQWRLVRAATAAVTEAAPASRRQATTALTVVPVRTTSSTTTMWRPAADSLAL